MKKLAFWITTLVLVISEGWAQGMLAFTNRTRSGDRPVYWPDGSGPGSRATAGLYWVQGDSMTLVATEPFNPRVDLAYFFGAKSVFFPDVPPSTPATFRVRVWETSAGSFENAIAIGAVHGEFPTVTGNNEVTIELGDGRDSVPTLDGLLPFTLVPEPSSTAIALAASAIFFVSRCAACRRES